MNNSVELIGHYGGDITHSLSAWTSTSRDLTPEKIARIPKLLKDLAALETANGEEKNEHGTPFEKSMLHFLVEADVASHIHLLKHRIGVSINGESARYRELKGDRFYIPHDWPLSFQSHLETKCKELFEWYHEAIDELVNEHGFERARAKESARYFLPYAAQTKIDISFNFRSFVHFQRLRNAPDAQKEIREIAKEMLWLVREIPGNPFEHSIAAFRLNDPKYSSPS